VRGEELSVANGENSMVTPRKDDETRIKSSTIMK
jgi:hypothetical protein